MVSSRLPGVPVTCSNSSTSAEVPNNNNLVVSSSSTERPVYNLRNDDDLERDLRNRRPGWNSESGPPSLSMSIDLHHATSGQHDSGSFSASPDRNNALSCRVKVTESHEGEERYEGFGSVEGDCEEEVESPGGSSSAPSPTGPSSLRYVLTLLCLWYFTFYILIREGIRFMQNGTPPVFVKCPRFETL